MKVRCGSGTSLSLFFYADRVFKGLDAKER
jgi:hypothetical protein